MADHNSYREEIGQRETPMSALQGMIDQAAKRRMQTEERLTGCQYATEEANREHLVACATLDALTSVRDKFDGPTKVNVPMGSQAPAGFR